jgi:hypothetical protein
MTAQLSFADRTSLALADPAVVVNVLGRFRTQACPPWLPPSHPYPDGALPKAAAEFAAVSGADLLEVIAVRGPLHAIDGWTYLGRALSALLAGQAHAARHLAYYAELRAALSILASSGIGVFNRRNAVIDSAGAVHLLDEHGTHDMAWLALAEWSTASSSLERLIGPVKFAGASLLDPFREFFPGEVSTALGTLMMEWGFDLEQGASDRDQRNWSSYQPTALGPITTNPADDATFLVMFWNACRPNGLELERHLLRILLEKEARSLFLEVADYGHRYDRLHDGLKAVVPFDFLKRVTDPMDHEFLIQMSLKTLPAPPYAMMCRAALLLRLATGMAEDQLRAAGIQPFHHFQAWWQNFGASHGLWAPGMPPAASADLWSDIDLALEETASAPTGHRLEWVTALAGNAVRVCETERAALWGLFQ